MVRKERSFEFASTLPGGLNKKNLTAKEEKLLEEQEKADQIFVESFQIAKQILTENGYIPGQPALKFTVEAPSTMQNQAEHSNYQMLRYSPEQWVIYQQSNKQEEKGQEDVFISSREISSQLGSEKSREVITVKRKGFHSHYDEHITLASDGVRTYMPYFLIYQKVIPEWGKKPKLLLPNQDPDEEMPVGLIPDEYLEIATSLHSALEKAKVSRPLSPAAEV